MIKRELTAVHCFEERLCAFGGRRCLGIKPEQVLAAEGDVLKVRMEADIQVLDPGYMIGGAETTIHYACLPRLASPGEEGATALGLGAVGLCRKDHPGRSDPHLLHAEARLHVERRSAAK